MSKPSPNDPSIDAPLHYKSTDTSYGHEDGVYYREPTYNIRVKKITTPPKTPSEPQGRDTFETPNYAVDLLVPFLPKFHCSIWECAAGGGKIANRLEYHGFYVVRTDIRSYDGLNVIADFTKQTFPIPGCQMIVTNPPYSIKEQFIEKAFEFKIPFAFLINADYSALQISWIQRGCEKIIPTRRVDYITPNILWRIHEGELFNNHFKKLYPKYKKLTDIPKELWKEYLEDHKEDYSYSTLDEVPQHLKIKYTASQFHSMWLTYGFNLGRTETFVDLPIKEKKENI